MRSCRLLLPLLTLSSSLALQNTGGGAVPIQMSHFAKAKTNQGRLMGSRKGVLAYLNGSAKKPVASSSSSSPSSTADDDATRDTATAKSAASTESFKKELETWELNNAKVFSWLINSMEYQISLTLRTFTSAAAIWTLLEKVYAKASSSRLFELEYELAKLAQGDRDINNFYTAALDLWTEQDLFQ
ncbi:hypothetical protein LINGRAHAP2_LOCUS10744 [Linum grandiflorum]